jgi:hypothetical protein
VYRPMGGQTGAAPAIVRAGTPAFTQAKPAQSAPAVAPFRHAVSAAPAIRFAALPAVVAQPMLPRLAAPGPVAVSRFAPPAPAFSATLQCCNRKKRKRSSDDEPEEDMNDGDYTEGTTRRTGTVSKQQRNAIAEAQGKTILSRRGSFSVDCPDCGAPVHVHHDGTEDGVLEPYGKGAKRRMIGKQPPICHTGHNAASLLGAFDELAGEVRRDPNASSQAKTMFCENMDEFKGMRKVIEWGATDDLAIGHKACNSRHLNGDPSYKSLFKSGQARVRKVVRQRLKEEAEKRAKAKSGGFWTTLNSDGTVWGQNHPFYQGPGGGGGGGGGGSAGGVC